MHAAFDPWPAPVESGTALPLVQPERTSEWSAITPLRHVRDSSVHALSILNSVVVLYLYELGLGLGLGIGLWLGLGYG